MLQAVTRYCDHDKSVRGGDGTSAGIQSQRFLSANFGTGAQMKASAVQYLDDMADGAFLAAVAKKTAEAKEAGGDDLARLMSQPLRTSKDR